MFELYQLAQLVAFADCGTLAAAAEQLRLSQPALSSGWRQTCRFPCSTGKKTGSN